MRGNRKIFLLVPVLLFALACQTLTGAQDLAATAQAITTQAVELATQGVEMATQMAPLETAFAQPTQSTEPGAPPAPGETALPGNVFDPQDAPLAVWKEIPVMPQAAAGSEGEGIYSYRVNATVKDVGEFYAAQLPPLGWSSLFSGQDMPFLVYSKEGSTLTITITEGTNGTIVLLAKQ